MPAPYTVDIDNNKEFIARGLYTLHGQLVFSNTKGYYSGHIVGNHDLYISGSTERESTIAIRIRGESSIDEIGTIDGVSSFIKYIQVSKAWYGFVLGSKYTQADYTSTNPGTWINHSPPFIQNESDIFSIGGMSQLRVKNLRVEDIYQSVFYTLSFSRLIYEDSAAELFQETTPGVYGLMGDYNMSHSEFHIVKHTALPDMPIGIQWPMGYPVWSDIEEYARYPFTDPDKKIISKVYKDDNDEDEDQWLPNESNNQKSTMIAGGNIGFGEIVRMTAMGVQTALADVTDPINGVLASSTAVIDQKVSIIGHGIGYVKLVLGLGILTSADINKTIYLSDITSGSGVLIAPINPIIVGYIIDPIPYNTNGLVLAYINV